MRRETPILLAALAAIVSNGCSAAEAQSRPAAGLPVDQGRGPIELTVYAGDFAMVRETRTVELKPGRARVGLQGISKQLDQDSLLFGWPKSKDAKVVSSTYDLGTSSSDRLLERFLGQPIELVYRGQDGREGERVQGILEVAEPGNVVVRSAGKYIVNPTATIEAPSNIGIVTIPQLSAEVESQSGGSTELNVSYMTGGLSWNADYTLTLDKSTDRLALECWATVTNKTGVDFPSAKLSFVAGSPNRLKEGEARENDYARPRSVSSLAAKTLNQAFDRPQELGELYAYPYKSTATIRQNQMNRVRMMGTDSISVKRIYSIALPSVYREYAEFNSNPEQRLTATMGINFSNSVASGLGLPLPAGSVRVYEPDASGAVHYVGAAGISDTPKDAPVSMELTNVFDVYARAKQVSVQRIDKRHTRRTVQINVTNEKSKATAVRLLENFGANWKMETQTDPHVKLNASTAQWTVEVPAGGQKILRYTVVLAD